MNLLAIDSSTDVMSVGVQRTVDGAAQQWLFQGAGGAKASAALIGVVLDLIQQAQLRLADLDAICFGAGPGSFTGLRTACAVAQGLGFGAGVPLLPIDSLLAVAEDARFTALGDQASGQVMALLDARMDEVYCAVYAFEGKQWTQVLPAGLVRPEEVMASGATLAGNVFTVYAERLGVDGVHSPGDWAAERSAPCPPPALRAPPLPAQNALPPSLLGGVQAGPSAAAMLRLAPQLLAAGGAVDAAQALPHYIRDKVAKTTAERAMEKAAVLAAAAVPAQTAVPSPAPGG